MLSFYKTASNCRCFSHSSVNIKNCYDVVVVGGGIVGVASALEMVSRKPHLSVAVVEKEATLAAHQSGRNSGVIHAGIYYKPGSLRAKLCTQGMKLAYDYFDTHSVPYRKVGKLIVATHEGQLAGLEELYRRGQENGVPDLTMISQEHIKSIEPHCIGVKALHSPHTGIVDWGLVTRVFADDFKSRGGQIHLGFDLVRLDVNEESSRVGSPESGLDRRPVTLVSRVGTTVSCGFVLTCAGLYSDHVAALSGGSAVPPIVPVRGEYLILKPDKCHLVNGNIYPVPDSRFPFLGVHFTPRMDGSVWIGPNAILAASRHGYRYSDINMRELAETLRYKGFQKLARKYFDFGLKEVCKSLLPGLNMRELRKFIPSLQPQDILRGPSGVRAQAVSEDGELIEDFVFDEGERGGRVLHCRNAPSPAATSSLAIAQILADKVFNIMSHHQ